MKRPGRLSKLVLRNGLENVWPQVGEENVSFKRIGRVLDMGEVDGDSETEKAAEKANLAQKDPQLQELAHVTSLICQKSL